MATGTLNCSCSAPISNVDVKNMNNCGGSNEYLIFFDIANSRFKMKCTVF